MNWSTIEPKVDTLQADIVKTMSEIETLSRQDDKLPAIPASFKTAKAMVANPEFNVVVCGEVKKGKSSLLNAIIGETVLPVNVEIATSQVFRISNSDKESFSLVFKDGTSQPISREELSKYGSQVDANLQGEPAFKDRTLAYIQVNVPIAFLPKGVNLVDTPGLGALYKSHEWITQNYVKNASAVIFVLDPERPIVDKEKEFIQKVLGITRHILFVMTKIDQYSEEHCQEIINRDEELLALIYAEKGLKAPDIYPVSSTSLQKATTSKIEALRNANLKNSKYPEVKDQLMMLVYRAIGLNRTGLALQEAQQQILKARKTVTEILQVAAQENAEIQKKLSKEKESRSKELTEKYNEESAVCQEYMNEINAVCNSLQSRVQQIVMNSGPVYREYEAKIEALTSLEEAQELAKKLPQEVVNDVISRWECIAQEAQDRVLEILGRVGTEMDRIAYGLDSDGNHGALQVTELSVKEKIQCYRNQYFSGTWVSTIGAGILAGLGVISAPLIAPIVAVAAAIWSFFGGRSDNNERALKQNKVNFKSELNRILADLNVKLLHVTGSANRSVVADYSRSLSQMAADAIKNMLAERKQEVQKQLDDLNGEASLGAEERKKTVVKWTGIKNQVTAVVNQLNAEVALRNQIASMLN